MAFHTWRSLKASIKWIHCFILPLLQNARYISFHDTKGLVVLTALLELMLGGSLLHLKAQFHMLAHIVNCADNCKHILTIRSIQP